MARILVSGPSAILHEYEYKFAVFYEGFIQALIQCGNEVKALNSPNFLSKPWNGHNKTLPHIHQEKLARSIEEFAPELIIAFNHSIPRIILERTDCKIAVWDADSIQFYNDKAYIRKHLDRYIFLCFSKAGVNNALEFGASKSQTHLVLAGTAIQAEILPQNMNISFIGTCFMAPPNFMKLLQQKGSARVRPIVEDLAKDFYADHREIVARHKGEWVEDYIDIQTLASISSTQNRISLLNELRQFGLTIYGTPEWYGTASFLPWLAMCYDDKKVFTLKHNQDIYNASKICINISHVHAVDGFPWRNMDIMASNGCLVSDRKTGLAEFTKGYVDIPMYESHQEAVDLCSRLLKDEAWRRDIIAGSQQCIEDRGRWRDRFKELSSITGVSLYQSQEDERKPMTREKFEKQVLSARTYPTPLMHIFISLYNFARKVIPESLVPLVYHTLAVVNIRPSLQIVNFAKNAGNETE